MTRLVVVVEGQTEEEFVRKLLVPHLGARGIFVSATIVGKSVAERRGHTERGGGHFRHWLRDIRRILGDGRDSDLRVTTMFDLYGLLSDFPSFEELSAEEDTNRRCDALQEALAREVGDRRFLPYVQRHEFEALVFASLQSLRAIFDDKDDLEGLDSLAQEVSALAPEDINDGRETAPSKRLQRHLPGYRKSLHGVLATEVTGLEALRVACPRFGLWIKNLEAL